MATAQVLMKVGILIVSFLVGLLFFYMMSSASKETKKKQLEEVTSQVINFIIYIWIGKIIFHFNLFVQDPFAVLAYPSNANAFYIATILFLITITYRVYRKKTELTSFIVAFVPIFLVTSFVYEFIQLIYNEANNFTYLALLTGLLIIYVSIVKKANQAHQIGLIGLWAVGQLGLSFAHPFVMSFEYILSRYFFIGVIVLCIVLYAYNKQKKVKM